MSGPIHSVVSNELSRGYCVVLADAPTIETNAALTAGSLPRIFRVIVDGDRTLANPTNALCCQQITWCIVNNSGSEITITLGDKFVQGATATITSEE